MKTPPATDQLTLFYSSLLLSPPPLLQMDSENQKTEKPERFASWSLSEERVSSSTRNKSFTCSFCRREFSNAQALGGHMNIHRRDRAKLRNASPDEQISSTSSPSQVLEEKDLVILESSQDQKSSSSTVTNTARSCNFGVDDEAGTSKVKDSSPVVVKKKIQPVEGSSEPELDLELRLGPKGFF